VRFVQDEDVKIVGLGIHELVEVLEHALHAFLANTSDPAKGLGERAGAGGVKDGSTTAGEFAEQRQRNDALPAAWAASDDDDGLPVGASRTLNLVQHHRVSQLLLCHKDELLSPLDFLGRDREQLLRRSHRGVDQLIGVGAAGHCRVEPVLEELDELATSRPGEESTASVLGVVVEISDIRLGHCVVQVRRAGQGIRLPVEELGEIGEIVAVPADLRDRMEPWCVWVSVDQDELTVVLPSRDTGTAVTLTVKEIAHDGIDGTTETEVVVGDFAATNELLRRIGFEPKSYQENRRASFELDGAQLEIDWWPLIPPYLEIEGESRAHVIQVGEALGISEDQMTGENTIKVCGRYGIDLTAISDLRFPG
jgi:adenylate cyclase class 2